MKNFLKQFPKLVSMNRKFRFIRSWLAYAPFLKSKSFGKIVLISNSKISFFFPYPNILRSEPRQLKIINKGYLKHMWEKYTCENFFVEPDDIVIDCGGFIGGFSLAASKIADAKKVVYIEPTRVTRKCASLNFLLYDVAEKVHVVPNGLGSKNETLLLNLSTSACDNSFLSPDAGDIGRSEAVSVITLASLLDELDVKSGKNVFMKLEAEGFEPEILRGFGSIRPEKLVIDITPERDGSSPTNLLFPLLDELDYKIVSRSTRCLFCRQK